MGYLFLSIALLTGAIKGYCGKKTSSAVTGVSGALLANFLRMLLCIVIGFAIICFQKDVSSLKVSPGVLGISLLSGASLSAFVVTWLLSVRKGAYMMVDVFLMLGTVIPMSVSALLFQEKIELNQIIGFAILVAAALVMCSYNNSIKEKMSASAFLVLLMCGITSGVADLSQKIFVKNSDGFSNAVFNFYTYVFSALVIFICYFAVKGKKDGNETTLKSIKRVFGYISVMSLCLFLNSYFKTEAALYLPASILYPMAQGCSLILATAVAAVFFKEKVTAKAVLGISLAFVGMLIMNLL